jgi:hypothetical protein
VEETGVPEENHWPAVSHWQTLSHKALLVEYTTLVVLDTDYTGSCLSTTIQSWPRWPFFYFGIAYCCQLFDLILKVDLHFWAGY